MVPLIMASGAGARSRFDIGLVIAMGMAVGTLFTLFITPAVYTFIARDHSHDREKEAGGAVSASPAETKVQPAE
jgi:Cu/Ag efflux pump CusA